LPHEKREIFARDKVLIFYGTKFATQISVRFMSFISQRRTGAILLHHPLCEPVSVGNRTGLCPTEMEIENGDQRPAPKTRPAQTEMAKIAGQRLGHANLTRGNVGDSTPPGNNTPETGLAGCPERIRTLESGDARPAPGKGLTANGGAIGAYFSSQK
jgi:hypothetical protein